MNKKTSIVIVIVVLVAIILFRVGQFFAHPSEISQNASSTSGARGTNTPATQVIAYAPPALTSSTQVEEGSCWTNSIAAPFRADAWRCAVGNGISDPCFEIPGGNDLLCGANPASPDATSSFVLQLTQALPTVQVPQGSIPQNWAWLVELSDGTLCSPFTGTLPIAQGGISANYGCAPSVPGGEGLYIFGDMDSSSSEWTASVGTLSAATSGLPTVESSETVPVAAVWQ